MTKLKYEYGSLLGTIIYRQFFIIICDFIEIITFKDEKV